MAEIPFHFRYTLSRSQRIVPNLRIWGVAGTVLVVVFFLLLIETVESAYRLNLTRLAVFGILALGWFVVFRGMFVGLLDPLLVPVRTMDVVIEENAAGILIGTERWYLFLEGITDIRKYRDDTWTIQHWNGAVFHIGASAITEDQIEYLRRAMERGRTPEGIKAVIERGKRIEEIMKEERKA